VIAEAMSKRDGRAVDVLGTYNPKSKELQLDVEKVKEWLSKGAEPTPRVASLIKKVLQ
jgi:small subunit ribosomal protein S16